MKLPLLLLLIPAALCSPAWAARPFVTDDARLTTAGSCQMEIWTRIYRDSREQWALPACNPGGNLEITAGAGRSRATGAEATHDYVLQAKTLFRQLETNGWGWGLAAGMVSHPEITPGPNLLGNTYLYVPVSISFLDDRVILHLNSGVLRDRASGLNNLTWGVGSEIALSGRLSGILEAYGDHRNQPYWQTGVRLSLIPNLLQVDTTVGGQYGGPGGSHWISVGLRYTPDKVF